MKTSAYGQIVERWDIQFLKNLCVPGGIQTGPFGSQLHQKDYLPVGTPIITVEHLGENRIVHEDLPRISDEDKDRLSRYIMRKGDIIFSRVGSVDRRSLVRNQEDGWLFSGRCLRVRPDPKKVNPDFLSWFFGLEAFKDYIRRIAVGATMPSLNTEILSNVPIVVPPLHEQRAIADVLGSLDDKIELNRRMNATLESMARAVFKAWFMENEEAKGWKIGQIKDLGDVVCGKTPPTNDKENYDGDIPFITIPDMHNKVFITQTRKTLSEKGAQTQSKKTLPVFAICVSCIATPGLVSLTTKPSQTNQQINNLVPNDKKSVFYCYYALRALADEIRARGSGGSVVVNLNKGQFEILPVVIPPATKLHEFQEQVEPLFLRLLANENESRTLAALRDALLPRLMSGEVRVKADKTNSPIEKG